MYVRNCERVNLCTRNLRSYNKNRGANKKKNRNVIIPIMWYLIVLHSDVISFLKFLPVCGQWVMDVLM